MGRSRTGSGRQGDALHAWERLRGLLATDASPLHRRARPTHRQARLQPGLPAGPATRISGRPRRHRPGVSLAARTRTSCRGHPARGRFSRRTSLAEPVWRASSPRARDARRTGAVLASGRRKFRRGGRRVQAWRRSDGRAGIRAAHHQALLPDGHAWRPAVRCLGRGWTRSATNADHLRRWRDDAWRCTAVATGTNRGGWAVRGSDLAGPGPRVSADRRGTGGSARDSRGSAIRRGNRRC